MNQKEKSINVWEKVLIYIGVILSIVVIVCFVIKQSNITFEEGNNASSYTVAYNDVMYHVVPRDILESNKEYKNTLKKYNMDINIGKKNIGKCVAKLNNSSLYRVKNTDTLNVLILKDSNNEYVYVFLDEIK